MRSRYTICCGLLFVGTIGWLTWNWWSAPLQPETASRHELLRWVVSHSIMEQPAEFQARIYARCQVEITNHSPSDWSELTAALQHLTADQQAQWQLNLRWYGERWLSTEAARYEQIAKQLRNNYLRQRLQDFAKQEWPIWQRVLAGKQQSASTEQRLIHMVNQLEAWIANSAANEQTRLQEFWHDLRWYLLWHPESWPAVTNYIIRYDQVAIAIRAIDTPITA